MIRQVTKYVDDQGKEYVASSEALTANFKYAAQKLVENLNDSRKRVIRSLDLSIQIQIYEDFQYLFRCYEDAVSDKDGAIKTFAEYEEKLQKQIEARKRK